MQPYTTVEYYFKIPSYFLPRTRTVITSITPMNTPIENPLRPFHVTHLQGEEDENVISKFDTVLEIPKNYYSKTHFDQ